MDIEKLVSGICAGAALVFWVDGLYHVHKVDQRVQSAPVVSQQLATEMAAFDMNGTYFVTYRADPTASPRVSCISHVNRDGWTLSMRADEGNPRYCLAQHGGPVVVLGPVLSVDTLTNDDAERAQRYVQTHQGPGAFATFFEKRAQSDAGRRP